MISNLILDRDKNSSEQHYWLNWKHLSIGFLDITGSVKLFGRDMGLLLCGRISVFFGDKC